MKARSDPYPNGDGDRCGGLGHGVGGGARGAGRGEGVHEVEREVEARGEEQGRGGDGGRGQAGLRGCHEGLHEPRRHRRRAEAEECEVEETRSPTAGRSCSWRWLGRRCRGMGPGGGAGELGGRLLVTHRRGRRRRVRRHSTALEDVRIVPSSADGMRLTTAVYSTPWEAKRLPFRVGGDVARSPWHWPMSTSTTPLHLCTVHKLTDSWAWPSPGPSGQ